MRIFASFAVAVMALPAASAARAACCDIAKIDAETPPALVRACEPDGAGGCGTILFERTLSLGDSENVCVSETEVVYQEFDESTQAFGPATVAVCDGGDVEL